MEKNENNLTHQLLLADSQPGMQHCKPLRVQICVNPSGITVNTQDENDFCTCDIYLEHYNGKLVLHVATADNPDEHAHRIIIGKVTDGNLVPSSLPNNKTTTNHE